MASELFIPFYDYAYLDRKAITNMVTDLAEQAACGKSDMWAIRMSCNGLTIKFEQAAEFEHFADMLEPKHLEYLRQRGFIDRAE